MLEDAITVFKTGSNIAFGAASASVAIPATQGGIAPNYVRLASTQACYVKVGKGAQTAVAGDLLIQPADSVVLKVAGVDTIAALQVTTGGVLQISPLEDV